jgi:hypothetical protein
LRPCPGVWAIRLERETTVPTAPVSACRREIRIDDALMFILHRVPCKMVNHLALPHEKLLCQLRVLILRVLILTNRGSTPDGSTIHS